MLAGGQGRTGGQTGSFRLCETVKDRMQGVNSLSRIGVRWLGLAYLLRIRLHWLRTPIHSMARASLSFRPTEAQRQWLDRQRRERGIPVTTVIQLLLEQAIATSQELHERP